ncbi:hypothetical protein [Powai lake megavirus]|uniref:Uncharacterized protein n=1 Tax=Powai lake megavirus TaxID=1842663 RepID=A0A167R320_9VIRU|nr:hypothetical protein QJ849_gp087 [Powai lake megavirus]ANB50249.1 hypothetical protein [Powai lake megavirus]
MGLKCVTHKFYLKMSITNILNTDVIICILDYLKDDNKMSFNQNIKGCIRVRIHAERIALRCIPNNVTHLTFGWGFNQKIKDRIPDSVTHLTLNKYFYEWKKKYIRENIQIHFL